MIILIPKTEARAQGDEVNSHHNLNSLRITNICVICFVHNHVYIKYIQVTLTKILQDRVGREDTAAKILKHYRGKMSSNVKKVGKHFDFYFVHCGLRLRSDSTLKCSTCKQTSGLVMDAVNPYVTLPVR